MRTSIDERLRDEATRFSLRHTCDACAHFDGARCGDAWPTEQHRLPLAGGRRADSTPSLGSCLAGESTVVFCKEFELA